MSLNIEKKSISGITMDVLDYQNFFANLLETYFQNRLSLKCEIILCVSLSWKNPSVWLGKKLSLKLEIDQTWKRFSRIGTFSGFLLETKWSTFQTSTPLQGEQQKNNIIPTIRKLRTVSFLMPRWSRELSFLIRRMLYNQIFLFEMF